MELKFGAQFPQIEIAKRFVTENLGDRGASESKEAKEEEARREREVQERLLQNGRGEKEADACRRFSQKFLVPERALKSYWCFD